MEPRLFVFDWSGTISDDRKAVYIANMRLLREHKKSEMTFEEWLPRTRMTPVEFLADYGINGDPNELFRRYTQYFEEAEKAGIIPTPYPDVRDTLQYLRGQNRKVVVLSSHPEENLRREATQYKLTQLFSLILGNSRDKVQGLLEICRRFGLTSSEVLYTGDTIYDVRAGKEAGTHTAAVCTGYHTRERLKTENPDLLLETLSELRNGAFGNR